MSNLYLHINSFYQNKDTHFCCKNNYKVVFFLIKKYKITANKYVY